MATKRRRLRRKRRRYRDRRSQRGPKRRELVYLDQSPNYCLHNPKMGILGTRGRRCSKNSNGPDSCDLLCCGRGYNTEVRPPVGRHRHLGPQFHIISRHT